MTPGTRFLSFVILITFFSSLNYPQNSSGVTLQPTPQEDLLKGWKEFSSDIGGFKIRLPKSPQKRVLEVRLVEFKSKAYLWGAQSDLLYSVMYVDAPHQEDEETTNYLLKGMSQLIADEWHGRLLTVKTVSNNNCPGLLFDVELTNKSIARGLVLIAGPRIYAVLAGPGAKPEITPNVPESIVVKYFESFRLTSINRKEEGDVDKYLREHPLLAQELIKPSDGPSGEVLNGRALKLPKPAYPFRVTGQGRIIVRIIVNEKGEVVAAQAENGPSVFREVVEEAARKAVFRPTSVEGKPVIVMGVIHYNFVRK